MNTFNYAPISKRVISFIIDDLTVSLLYITIFYNQISNLKSQDDIISFILEYSWVLLLIKIMYHTFFIAYNGATIGKFFAKIKAVDEVSGHNVSWTNAFIRALVREVGESFFYFTFIFAFFDKKKQTLHDKFGKCVVINAEDK